MLDYVLFCVYWLSDNIRGRLKCTSSEGTEIPETGSPVKFLTAMLCSLTQISIVLIMSTLQNEVLLENIYEEFMVELFDTGNDKKMTEDEINAEVIRRFWDYTN